MLLPYTPPSVRRFAPSRAMEGGELISAPFTYDLVHALRPGLMADLGAGTGNASFFACCQSIRDHDIDGIAYAYDDWTVYTGEGAPTYEEVTAHGRQFYMGIAYFVRMDPRLSARHFAEGSVALVALGRGVLAEDVPAWVSLAGNEGAILVREIDRPPGKDVWAALASHGGTRMELGTLGVFLGMDVRAGELVRLLRSPEEHDGLRRFYDHVSEFHRLRQLTSSQAYSSKKKRPL